MSSNEAAGELAISKSVVETSETTITTLKAGANGTAGPEIQTTVTEVVTSPDAISAVTPAKVAAVTAKTVSIPAKAAAKAAPAKSSPSEAAAVPKASAAKVAGAADKAKPSTAAGTKAPAAAKMAPPGYKLIKVKNAEGKIIVVKKKLTAAELSAAEEKGQSVAPDNTASGQTKSVEYKIVSIPQQDGTLVKVRRAVHPEDVTEKPVADIPAKDGKDDRDAKAAIPEDEEEEPIDEAKRQEMIRNQKHKFRTGRTRKYSRSVLRGFAMQLIGEMPDIELDSGGFRDGDQVISDDDSDLDFDSDGEDNDLFGNHDFEKDERGVDSNNDGQNSNDIMASGSKANINTQSIAENVFNAATRTQSKKKTTAAKANDDAPQIEKAEAPVKGLKGVKGATEKVTYKMTEKDLEKVDEDKPSSQLRHHWETISFYLMASLSIILPLLFVILAIGATVMNGKSVGSNWDAVANALKVAVSAWPIVFAAVVAQCFKTYATYKVERGIKLMQLEQLVGSNSFASALKQPIMLRRLDVYTLAIFVAWCLSPIGGQAIVRVQTSEWTEKCVNTTVWYLSRNGLNPVFDSASDNYRDGNDVGTHLQQATLTFGTLFNPYAGLGGKKTNFFQDAWGNPQTFMHTGNLSSVFGVPYFVTDSLFYAENNADYYDNNPLAVVGYNGDGADTRRQESFDFPIQSSYFNFACGDWTTLSSDDMANKINEYDLQCTVTNTPTYYLSFGWTDDEMASGASQNLSANVLRWGSFNWLTADANSSTSELLKINSTDSNLAPMRTSTATYSYIECPITQQYLEYSVSCGITQEDFNNGAAYQCLFDDPIGKKLNTTQSSTQFYDFTADFVGAVAPTQYTSGVTITPFERFLASGGRKFDTLFEFTDFKESPGQINSSYAFWYDMGNNTTPDEFGGTFAFAFNSWMDSGYCPGACRTAYPTLLLNLANQAQIPIKTEETMTNASAVLSEKLLVPDSMFQPATSTWCYSDNYVYVVQAPYLALLYICSVSLFLLGVISVIIESRIVAPDVLGYASTVARNSRYLHLPAMAPGMSGADRVRKFGGTVVMMQDVKKDAPVGKIALGNKKQDSAPLRVDRPYR